MYSVCVLCMCVCYKVKCSVSVLWMCVCMSRKKVGGPNFDRKIICTLIFRERRDGQYCPIQIDTEWHGSMDRQRQSIPQIHRCILCICFLTLLLSAFVAQLKDCLYYLFLRIQNFEIFVK